MIAVAGILLLHLAGSVVRHLTTRMDLRSAVASASSAWFAIVSLYLLSLQSVGVALLVLLIAGAWRARASAQVETANLFRNKWWWAFVVLVLLRPWVPTQWDEFVWLGKARLESLGFGAGVRAALDPASQLIPAGYPPLWPATVGWISLGADDLSTHVVAASVLVLLCVATAIEAVTAALLPLSRVAIVVVVTSPLVWVHVRSTYVDLPVGLLGLALFALLIRGDRSPTLLASLLGLALVGFKDEGLISVFAASLAALMMSGWRRWRLAIPAVIAACALLAWRWLVASHQVQLFDHSLNLPQWDFVPTLVRLLALHASDVMSWGVFWSVAVALFFVPLQEREVKALRLMLTLLCIGSMAGIVMGPERVRVFAESGTLLNRLLMQLWPTAAWLVIRSVEVARLENDD